MVAPKIDYYAVLTVSPSAKPDEIKSAFRRLAKRYHTDTAHGDAEKFKAVAVAYETLGDPDLRKKYDEDRYGDLHQVDPQLALRRHLNTFFGVAE